jgi:tRNA G18 (ribose-2'-O)-methylase SpoU
VEGLTVTERLLGSGLRIASVLTNPACADRLRPQLAADVPLYVVPERTIETLVGFNFHRGVLACGFRPEARALENVLATLPPRLVITVCVGIQDPENLGAIIRTSAALGVQAVLLGPHCSDPFTRRVARTSMGGNFTVPIVAAKTWPDELLRLREQHGCRLVASVVDAEAQDLTTAARPARVALLIGSEGSGLPRECLELCDDRVTIPMPSAVDSLNASVAAGIFLYRYTQQ